jgi:hypothetical protein
VVADKQQDIQKKNQTDMAGDEVQTNNRGLTLRRLRNMAYNNSILELFGNFSFRTTSFLRLSNS